MPKNDQIWPKTGIFGQFGPGHASLFSALLVGRLVVVARGLYLARHLFTLYSLTDTPTYQCLFAQVATHAPLMMAVPGKTDSGLRSSQLVEFVDIFPTIVEAAGLPTLTNCPELSNSSHICTEGSSLMPLIEDPESSDWKKAVFWQYPRLVRSMCSALKFKSRGGNIVDHLKSIMGYSMRTSEWRYTEWV